MSLAIQSLASQQTLNFSRCQHSSITPGLIIALYCIIIPLAQNHKHNIPSLKPPNPTDNMKTFVTLVAFLAPAAVLAQTATTTATSSSSTCEADYIVEDCLTSTQARQADCGSQDYSCQCAAYQAIAT